MGKDLTTQVDLRGENMGEMEKNEGRANPLLIVIAQANVLMEKSQEREMRETDRTLRQ